MRRAVAANFRAHADIRDVLLSTGDEAIVEDTEPALAADFEAG